MAERVDVGPVSAQATLRYHRTSAQKAGLVLDQIRGRNVNDALALLRFSPKEVARPIDKLLRSAVANADRAESRVDADRLYVAEAYAGPGPSLKRFRGRAFGRAFRVLHRSCHITLKLRARQTPLAVPAGKASHPAKASAAGKGSPTGKAAARGKATPVEGKKKPAAGRSGRAGSRGRKRAPSGGA